MKDIEKVIQDLQSDDLEKRYEACKQLELESQLPKEAINALRSASEDSDPLVAVAAQWALKSQKSINNTLPDVNSNEELVKYITQDAITSTITPHSQVDIERETRDNTPSLIIWLIAGAVAIFLSCMFLGLLINALTGIIAERLDISGITGICAVATIIPAIYFWIFVFKNLKGQLIKYQIIGENNPERKQKQRHGCLTIWIAWTLIANTWVVISLGLNLSDYPQQQNTLINVNPFLMGLSAFNVLCIIALFKWQKWGFWGLCSSSVAWGITSLATTGATIFTVIFVILEVGIMFGVLQIGKENKGWPQLE